MQATPNTRLYQKLKVSSYHKSSPQQIHQCYSEVVGVEGKKARKYKEKTKANGNLVMC